MRSAETALGVAALLLASCGPKPPASTRTNGSANVLSLSVNGSLCAPGGSYLNKPCVQVQVCAPGTSDCRTIDDVLLDTGSFGLRIFRQALGTLSLQQSFVGPDPVATCAQFADQTSDWGPVQVADVVLGGEPAVRVPIQVIDATFGTPPASCPDPEASPAVAGLTGILGVGVFLQDCGAGCEQTAANGIYFACGASGCTGTALPLGQQVQNPVALLARDNNGVIVDLPAVGAAGSPSVEGSLLLGIGTEANNSLAGATTFRVDPADGTFTTTLGGEVLAHSLLDTGSDGLFFAPPSPSVLPECSGSAAPWFCPSTTVSLTATNTGQGGSASGEVSFQIANFERLPSANQVFPDLGGEALPQGGFDWGLPFYLGRRVAIGFEGAGSPGGPYVAY